MTFEPRPEDRCTVGLWCTAYAGREVFGGEVWPPLDPLANIRDLAAAGCWGFDFHDDDLVPFGSSAAEAERILGETRDVMTQEGMSVGMATCNMFEQPVFRDGALTSNDARIPASAQQKAMRAADMGWAATLPPVVTSRSLLSRLRPEVAALTGLSAGTPLSAGGGDNMCSAIGVGAIEPGPVVVSLGTSGTAFEAALAGTNPGASGLSFLPYLDGERTPDLPSASGTFAGLRGTHRPADMVRAVAEGVTFGLRYGLDALRRAGVTPQEVTLVGGGAASDAWAQLCADVLELPVRRPTVTEAAARGAALQARWVVDGVAPATDAADGERLEPVPSQALIDAAARQEALRRPAVQGSL